MNTKENTDEMKMQRCRKQADTRYEKCMCDYKSKETNLCCRRWWNTGSSLQLSRLFWFKDFSGENSTTSSEYQSLPRVSILFLVLFFISHFFDWYVFQPLILSVPIKNTGAIYKMLYNLKILNDLKGDFEKFTLFWLRLCTISHTGMYVWI